MSGFDEKQITYDIVLVCFRNDGELLSSVWCYVRVFFACAHAVFCSYLVLL